MKPIISKIVLSSNPELRHGLGELIIEGMSPVMAIAGPNGSGKSRLLRCIKEAIEAPERERALKESLRLKNIERVEFLAEVQHPGLPPELAADRDQALDRIDKEAVHIDLQIMQLPKIWMEPGHGVKLLDLKTKRPEILSVGEAKISEIAQAAAMPGLVVNFELAMKNAKRRIFKVSQDYIAARSAALDVPVEDDQATGRFMDLDILVFGFLGAPLRHDIEHSVTLFGRPLDEANLSDGQSLLLQFVAALFGVQDEKPCVVLIDEPENHLHPAAQIKLIEQLKCSLPNGQIIIATHSVPLLAHIGVGNIWSMKEGRLSKSGKDIQDVLVGLMGGLDDIFHLRDFIDEPDRIAAVEFAKECLAAPVPAAYKDKDPQQEQMVGGLAPIWPKDRPLRLVDWGAGKGRLAIALREHQLLVKERAAGGVEYFAFNPVFSKEDREACLAAMALLDSRVDRFLTNYAEVEAAFSSAKADAVVLCNCLHEIEPEKWPEVFARIGGCLSDDGVLIMVEDLEIPVGELAFPQGFFLLDAKSMAALLGVEVGAFATSFPDEPRYAGRLVRYTVPKKLLAGVDGKSVRAAIEQSQASALDNIKALRTPVDSSKHFPEWKVRLRGRRHSLFAQQVANATLFLKGLGEPIPAVKKDD